MIDRTYTSCFVLIDLPKFAFLTSRYFLQHGRLRLAFHQALLDIFCNKTEALIKKSVIPPQRLCFEITETAAMNRISKTMETVSTLQAIGCKIALDDFGVGLSSFSYIKKFYVNIIKIDGSFVKNVVHEEMDRAIVQTMNEMAHRMGMETVAEYVENQEILDIMAEIGVDYVQGYAIDKPEPLSNIIS